MDDDGNFTGGFHITWQWNSDAKRHVEMTFLLNTMEWISAQHGYMSKTLVI